MLIKIIVIIDKNFFCQTLRRQNDSDLSATFSALDRVFSVSCLHNCKRLINIDDALVLVLLGIVELRNVQINLSRLNVV